MASIWEETAEMPRFPALKQDLKTDILIIGGGLAGLLCGYFLDRDGADYALVEADTLCSGITRNTTAKITCQHGLVYDKLLRRFGQEKAQMYLDANLAALDEFRRLGKKVPCHFERKPAYVYSLDDREKIERELAALARLHHPGSFLRTLKLPLPVAGAIRMDDQAQFHPVEFAAGIAKNLRVFEHTKVRELVGTTAVTEQGRIQAKKILVATHFPFLNKHGSYFLKLYQHRSYVLALENGPDVEGMYIDEDEKGLSFRNYDDFLLLGGGSHRTGKRGGGWQELSDFAVLHYPGAREVCRWATQDCMSLDGVPYVGPYSARTRDLFVASGFNKWGMTGAMVSAMLLSDLAQGRENPYAPVFSPSRTILRPQLAVNGVEAVGNLLTISGKRCPHMGCALKWNPQERTWDCPCHGSRFTRTGKLIDNPATGNWKGPKS